MTTDESNALDDLEAFAESEEVEVQTTLRDGSPSWVPIWVVRVGDALYARSAHGPKSAWYVGALADGATRMRIEDLERDVEVTLVADELRPEVSAAYLEKYAKYPQIVEPMTGDDVVSTTVRFDLD